MASHARKKTGLRGTGISRVDDLFVPFTESRQPRGVRGGRVSVLEYWGLGYPTWEGAKAAHFQGREAAIEAKALDAVQVDQRTGRRIITEGGGRP